MSINDIPLGPYSEHDLRSQWNAQADEFNQWESLDLSEQLAWAQARAIAATTSPAPGPTTAELMRLYAACNSPSIFARVVLALGSRPTTGSREAGEAQREAILQAVAESLGEAYDCLRVWEAWGVGTMGADDFQLVAEDPDRVAEIADAVIAAMRPTTPPAPEPGEVENGPTDEEIYQWWENNPQLGFCTEPVKLIRAAITRWRHADPPAPEPGEIAELVEFLTPTREQASAISLEAFLKLRRAAALLQQLSAPAPAPVPVPVSERPWDRDVGWCDSDGDCWWCPPSGPRRWILVNPAMVHGGWLLPAHFDPDTSAPDWGRIQPIGQATRDFLQ